MAYADVEIRIRERVIREVDDQPVSCYPVEITVDGEREFPQGYLDAATQPPNPTDAHYADAGFGQKLFAWLFEGQQLKENWAEIRGAYPQRRLRLRIDADAPELHRVVWESLCEPKRKELPQRHLAAGSATPFSRYLSGRTPHGKPVLGRPIKILVVAPAQVDFEEKYPQDQYPDMAIIKPDEEFQALQDVLQPLTQEEVQPTLLPQPCTLAAIAQELQQGYHVLHLICHGAYNETTHQSRLILANANNKVKPELDTDVTVMLAHQLFEAGVQDENKLRLVFLASCESAKRSSANAYRGLAPQLVNAGVPAVVAMQEQVGKETAREFARVFYGRLLDHGQVDLAANEARQIVMAAGLPGPVIPVLFLRLRSGMLLGQRGKVSSQSDANFWPFLLKNIGKDRCTVFLGPHIHTGVLPSRAHLADKLAQEYGYPLRDTTNLAHVAQYMAIHDPEQLRDDYLQHMIMGIPRRLGLGVNDYQKEALQQKKTICEAVDELDWTAHVAKVQEQEPHLLLADLPIGLYLTSNVDGLMHAALTHKIRRAIQEEPDPDKKLALETHFPRRVQPRWEKSSAGQDKHALRPAPDPDHPVIVHLNGYDEDPEHMVLSEDDYLHHLVRLNSDQDALLPTNVIGKLGQDSLVFIGYELDDWEFRVILHGLLGRIAQKKRHVGVQLTPSSAIDEDKARDYFQSYLSEHRIDIYWGSPQQFVSELHHRWKH
jgi:hypothetical protein